MKLQMLSRAPKFVSLSLSLSIRANGSRQ